MKIIFSFLVFFWRIVFIYPKIVLLKIAGAKIGRNVKFLTALSNMDVKFASYLKIEDNVTIAKNVMIFCHDGSPKRHNKPEIIAPILLKKNCFIGAGSILLPGVTIGESVIVGAGSIVTKSFDIPYAVIAGNPARIISSSQ